MNFFRHKCRQTNICFTYFTRWLDEGDGDSGVEQTLMLSEILVSDEEEAQEELPGEIL